MEEDYRWLDVMSNEFRNNYIIRSNLRRQFHTLASQESGEMIKSMRNLLWVQERCLITENLGEVSAYKDWKVLLN